MRTLRPFQEQALRILEDPNFAERHLLCVAATGSGKSLIYEQAALKSGRRTLLISPLIALARQQESQLKALGLPVALSMGGRQDKPHPTGIWILSPEKLRFASTLSQFNQWRPDLLVVDEAHCLWEWGEKFRPAFAEIAPLLKHLQIPRSLWLTATLPYEARLQLRENLGKELFEQGSFQLPPKLSLQVSYAPWDERASRLLAWVTQARSSGIIFVSTREATLRVAQLLAITRKKIVIYHAGLSREERINTEQQIAQCIPEIIVATSAFGMGMNYNYLRYVILWQLPPSLLSLVQIIGRVGRDPQQKAHAIVYWNEEDFRLLHWTIQNSERRKKEVTSLLEFCKSTECRRTSLRYYFDRMTSNENCLLCDICSHNPDIVE